MNLNTKVPFVVDLRCKLCLRFGTGMTGTVNSPQIIETPALPVTCTELPLHRQNQSNPTQDRREDSDHPQRPSAEQVERKARSAGSKSHNQKPLAKPRQGPRAVHFPFPDVASHPFKPELHIVLRNTHHVLSLTKAFRYVYYIQCVACNDMAGRGCGCLRPHPSMTS